MKIYDARRFLCRGGLAVLLGLSVSLAVAQDDSDNQDTAPFGSLGVPDAQSPDTDADPGIDLDAPAGREDQIGPYQVRRATADYMAGRLRVRDPATGEVRGVRPTEVMVLQNSQVVRRAETDVDGVVQIKDLPLGIYTVVARGPDGAGVFSFEVLPPVKGVTTSPYRFNALIVPTADLEVAGPPNAGAMPVPNAVPLPAGGVPAAPLAVPPIPVSTTNQPSGVVEDIPVPAPAVDQFATNGDIRTPMRGEVLLVRKNGRVGLGQVVVPSPGYSTFIPMDNLTISFIREGQILEQVTTDDQGYCDPIGLQPGIYSMVGYGPGGFVAIGAEVVDAGSAYSPNASVESQSEREYVALLQGGTQVWGVGGAPLSALAYFPAPYGQGPALAGPAVLPPPPPLGFAPGLGMGGGGFGGGFGGGGGLFGGGGLLGALVGAGVGAGVAAALSNDDDDDDDDNGGGNRRPASPARP